MTIFGVEQLPRPQPASWMTSGRALSLLGDKQKVPFGPRLPLWQLFQFQRPFLFRAHFVAEVIYAPNLW
jgi:hypothetical protein